MSKILVLGASGQLGSCIKAISSGNQTHQIASTPETEANILNIALLEKVFQQENPEFVINCAAYTAVDKAEDEPDIAEKINKTGVENISILCKQYGSTLIHVSTDFVFEGNLPRLLIETDVAEPISVYGQTKLEGEQVIANHIEKFFILRTSWLYSEYGNNFVKTMLRLGSEKDELKIIVDQVGTPTYGIDLAKAIMTVIESGSTNYGIYHFSNEGLTSWYDFAKAIFDLGGLKLRVLPVSTSEYVTKAVRPAFSVMDKGKIKSTFGIEIPYWRDSLATCIRNLQA